MSDERRRWCLTLNNWTHSEYSKIHDYMTTKTFWIIGKEVGEKNNTPHLQMYLENKSAIKFTTLKNLNNRLHIEAAKGTRKQNYIYCSKENNFITNIKEEDLEDNKLTKKEKKDIELKEFTKDFEYHKKFHNYIISNDTKEFYLSLDWNTLEPNTKDDILQDLLVEKESKDCRWCNMMNNISLEE